MPPSLIPSHPSHVEFPGVVQSSSPRIQENITFYSNQTGLPSQFGYSNARSMILLSTGLYAPPGEQVLRHRCPSDLIDSGALLQVGVHSDTLWHKSTIYRFPSIVRSFAIGSANISIANAFGGPIYLAVPPEDPLGYPWINFDGAVKAPKYEHGETSSSDWQLIRDYPAPWAEVSSDQFIMSVPSSEIRTLDDPGGSDGLLGTGSGDGTRSVRIHPLAKNRASRLRCPNFSRMDALRIPIHGPSGFCKRCRRSFTYGI